ncbi:hypothetical protein TBLA_0H03900 [Henningerozyma blattae CBS 6284]|uniref:Oxidoreductase-like domain-containing protein n=1 Tax=Henningerozyma blattae (strain ATCC 34711 / CBS 6284 / DSM 70876 / NBRC 10599 / NRRL Y-10934 / UCD 77-7) TaxID=1071380 RepID=I2H8G9_HENB6|nr:hypothetical protein TBLA_0H03900 [Tetrapisispora blattae CBS 6284]CCH62671.1 hypothetical protein TBLA_0H03900 [Tetrapisispora blattae CBS 6284]
MSLRMITFSYLFKIQTQTIRRFSSTKNVSMTFTGNSNQDLGTEEERMSRVFGGRLKGQAPMPSSRMTVQDSRDIAGVSVPYQPSPPDNCCMSGCVNCVWEMYKDDITFWQDRRHLAIENIGKTNEKWPVDWNPPLKLLDIKNVPNELKQKKLDMLSNEKITTTTTTNILFPKRDTPLPSSVLEAKRKNFLKRQKLLEMKKRQTIEEEDGWNDIPIYIKAFADFEKRKIRKTWYRYF